MNFIHNLFFGVTGTISNGSLTLANGSGEGATSVSIPIMTDYITIGLEVIAAIVAVGAAVLGIRWIWGIVNRWVYKTK